MRAHQTAFASAGLTVAAILALLVTYPHEWKRDTGGEPMAVVLRTGAEFSFRFTAYQEGVRSLTLSLLDRVPAIDSPSPRGDEAPPILLRLAWSLRVSGGSVLVASDEEAMTPPEREGHACGIAIHTFDVRQGQAYELRGRFLDVQPSVEGKEARVTVEGPPYGSMRRSFMITLLAALGVLVVVFAGVGWVALRRDARPEER